jgi:hypothetical protein
MKMEIWPDDVSMPEMTDWLAELRDEGRAEAAGDGPGERAEADETSPDVLVPAQPDRPVSEGQASGPAEAGPPGLAWPPAEADSPRPAWPPAEADSPRPAWPPTEADSPRPAWPTTDTSPTGRIRIPADASPADASPADASPADASPADASPADASPADASPAARTQAPAEAGSRSRARGPAKSSAPAEITERAVIGDQLRMPIMWCEMGSCISWHADPAALGEADIRARAIDVGWRVDAFGRLACPRCQQTAPGFRVSRPVVLWNRHAAITRAAWMAGMRANGAAGEHGRGPRPPASRRPGASPPEPQRRRDHSAAKTTTVGRHAR